MQVSKKELQPLCDRGAQRMSQVSHFLLFYSTIFYRATAPKYFLQNQNIIIFLLTESTQLISTIITNEKIE